MSPFSTLAGCVIALGRGCSSEREARPPTGHWWALTAETFSAGFQHALYAFVGLLPVGVTLGWLFLGRRSLYAPIGLHAAFNAIGVLVIAAAAGLR